MKVRIIFTIYLILYGFLSQASPKDSLAAALLHIESSQYQKALPILLKLVVRYRENRKWNEYAQCQTKIADCLRNFGAPNIALRILLQNESVLEAKTEIASVLLAQNFIDKGQALYDLNEFEQYKACILRSIKLKRDMGLAEHYFVEDYTLLSRYYFNVPNARDSVFYWAYKALKLAKTKQNNLLYQLPKIYNVIGFNEHLENNKYYNNKPEFYKVLHKSRANYDSALRLIAMQPVRDEITESKILHNLGNSFNNETVVTQSENTLGRSVEFYQRSIKAYKTVSAPAELAIKDWVIATAYDRLAKRDSALQNFQRGITRLIPGFKPKSFYDIPPLQTTLNDKLFLTFLPAKVLRLQFRYNETKNLEDLRAAYDHAIYTLRFYQTLLPQSSFEKEILHWNYSYDWGTYQRLAELAIELFNNTNDSSYLKKAYPYLASAKYAFLNKTNITNHQRDFLRKEVIEKEMNVLQKSILSIMPATVLRSYFKDLNFHTTTESPHNKSVEERGKIEIRELQQLLEPNSILIDFYLLGDRLSVFIIHKETVKVFTKILPLGFERNVRSLRREILSLSPREYAVKSNLIYSTIFDSLAIEFPSPTTNLIICADNYLNLIPWDGLVTNTTSPNKFKSLNYLINEYSVRTVLTPAQLLRKTHSATNNFLGVLPDYEHSGRFTEIPFSSKLVKNLGKLLDGEVKSRFIEDTLNYKILHIATHIHSD